MANNMICQLLARVILKVTTVPMHSGRGLSQWPTGRQVSTDEPNR